MLLVKRFGSRVFLLFITNVGRLKPVKAFHGHVLSGLGVRDLDSMGSDPNKGVRAAVVAQTNQTSILEGISGQVVTAIL